MTFKSLYGIVFLLLFSTLPIKAQEVELKLGRTNIALNEYFEITITIHNGKLKSYSEFPFIKGFSDVGNSTSNNINIINGRQTSSYSITKRYRPTQEGTFRLRAFTMEVNGKELKSSGARIVVGPAKQQSRNRFSNPFFDDPFFSRRQPQQLDFVEVDDDAFFHITANKNEIYKGEGVLLTYTMYIPFKDRQILDFKNNTGDQLAEIKEKTIPKYCIEENFPITQIERQQTEINGKPYLKFELYQSMIFPVSSDDITIPSVPLEMIKYQVSKQTDVFGRRQAKEDFKKFYSKKIKIKVKELPEHPLKDQVSVGQFRLDEKIDNRKVETGSSFNYTFSIIGKGNIASIDKPEIENNDNLEFFHPDITQKIERGMGAVTGHKKFNYNVLVNEPGEYALSDYFQWVYFDPVKARYDTLTSKISLTATGESIKNASIESNDFDGIYSNINNLSNELQMEGEGDNFTIFANIAVLTMTSVMVFVLLRRRKKKHG